MSINLRKRVEFVTIGIVTSKQRLRVKLDPLYGRCTYCIYYDKNCIVDEWEKEHDVKKDYIDFKEKFEFTCSNGVVRNDCGMFVQQ